jgi:diguanylate cyclase (GGDEF)-like protein
MMAEPVPHTDPFFDLPARILRTTLWISLVSYSVVLVMGLFQNDSSMFLPSGIGILLLGVPLLMLLTGRVQAGLATIALVLLSTLTILATLGFGIRDVAVVALPNIIIFAGLAMRRTAFFVSVGASLVSITWLVFGDLFGLYVPLPATPTDWTNYVILFMIILSTAFSVYLLARTLRNSLDQAQKEIAQRKLAEEQLRFHSLYDLMTGVYNRNFFEQELQRLESGRSYPVSVVVADLDGLKTINDNVGHPAGDQILRQTATLLQSAFRAEDILSRVGGDEFAALLPNTDAATAESIVQRILSRVEEYRLAHGETPIRLSIGTATAEKKDLLEAFMQADRRMYENKAARQKSVL